MRYATAICAAMIATAAVASPAWAEPVPEWVKSAAGWWAEGLTSDAEFVAAIQHLIGIGVITVEHAEQTGQEASETVPEWVEERRGMVGAEGLTSDAEFVAGDTAPHRAGDNSGGRAQRHPGRPAHGPAAGGVGGVRGVHKGVRKAGLRERGGAEDHPARIRDKRHPLPCGPGHILLPRGRVGDHPRAASPCLRYACWP